MWDWLSLQWWESVLPQYDLWIMFASAFLSSTILPGNSEVIFVALLTKQIDHISYSSISHLFAIAVLGNSLGSLTTYWLGRLMPTAQQKQQQNPRFEKTVKLLQRYGVWALFFSWLPVVGDLFCGIAGWLRLNAFWSFIFILSGKMVRYAFLLFLTINLF